ncbi:MAG: hypothetical protein K2N64_06715 [Anaeroplasmataceae bacterium]|nr:hypothetical protein [Anaeroplasmataceae bacterium]
MLSSKKLIKEINSLKEEMKQLESKRSRSMASILESLISHTEPNQTDVQFFRTFSAEIEVKREHLQRLIQQVEQQN